MLKSQKLKIQPKNKRYSLIQFAKIRNKSSLQGKFSANQKKKTMSSSYPNLSIKKAIPIVIHF